MAVALTKLPESRDADARRTDVPGTVSFSVALFLIVFGILRGNSLGWSNTCIVATLAGGVALLVVFVVIEQRQERPMFDICLFGQPSFTACTIATFCIAAGMFALFPYLSIYLQDIHGNSPLGAGLRFLPITAFIFLVPLVARRALRRARAGADGGRPGRGRRAPSWGAALGRLPGRRCSPGWSSCGHRDRDRKPRDRRRGAPGRRRAADRHGIRDNNTFRIGGVALGIAALGAILENRIASSLAGSLGSSGHGLANTVSSAGTRTFQGQPALAHAVKDAFVGGLGDLMLIGCVVLARARPR